MFALGGVNCLPRILRLLLVSRSRAATVLPNTILPFSPRFLGPFASHVLKVCTSATYSSIPFWFHCSVRANYPRIQNETTHSTCTFLTLFRLLHCTFSPLLLRIQPVLVTEAAKATRISRPGEETITIFIPILRTNREPMINSQHDMKGMKSNLNLVSSVGRAPDF
jgi:hypothetical protein